MKNQSVKICDALVHSGEKTTLALPLPEQYSCSPMYMPIKVINGKNKGPCILTFGMLEGDEFNGLEIINQLYDTIDPNELSGTLITVPALNVYGLTHYPKKSPSGTPIASAFPGDPDGDYSERIAHVFTEEILTKADYCIELKTGSLNHEIFPQVYCHYDNPESKRLAKAFQAPVVTEVENTQSELGKTTDNLNIPLIIYEAGEALRFNPSAIQTGLMGLYHVLELLEMHTLKDKDRPKEIIHPAFSKDEDWLTSHGSGILHSQVSLGASVKSGQKIAQLSDPFSNENSSIVKSHLDGVIVGINCSPLIQEGDRLFKIASFIDNKKAEAALEEWDELQTEQQPEN